MTPEEKLKIALRENEGKLIAAHLHRQADALIQQANALRSIAEDVEAATKA